MSESEHGEKWKLRIIHIREYMELVEKYLKDVNLEAFLENDEKWTLRSISNPRYPCIR